MLGRNELRGYAARQFVTRQWLIAAGVPANRAAGVNTKRWQGKRIVKQKIGKLSLLSLVTALAAPAYAQESAPVSTRVAPARAPDSAAAQEPPPAAPAENVIIVTADRVRGQVQTDVPPVVELDAADVAAVGASSLEDLIAQLAPQTGSGRGRGGRPVFLVNGQRVSSFRELRRYPPEAIQKVEVFPEEVALQFGYPADQRVINFILKDNFTSREFEIEYGFPTAGGRASGEVEVAQLTINGPNRLSLAADYNTSSLLTEADRGIIQTEGSQPSITGDPEPAAYRSLAADSEEFEVEGTWNTAFGEGREAATLSLNGSHGRAFSRGLSGLDTVLLTSPEGTALRTLDANPLTRRSKVITSALASSFNKPLGDWTLAVTGDGSLTESNSEIDRRRNGQVLQELVDSDALTIDAPLPFVPGAGRDLAESKLLNATTLATLRGTPLLLPGGELGVTFDTGFDWTRIASTDTRGAAGETVLKRGDLSAGVNLNIPIASAREGFLAPLGEFGINLGGGVNRLSDFGTLTDWTAAANWRPSESLSLQASYTVREAAPGLNQLGDPQIVSFNVPVFDFTTGDTVLASIVSGGNPFLLAETQRDIKLSASYDLDLFQRANVRVEYFRNRSENVTERFPLLTPEIEAAFPDRVTRENGQLVAIDRRPVTFAERNSSRIRYGFNVFGRIGKERPEPENPIDARFAAMIPPDPAGAGGAAARFSPERIAAILQSLCAGWDAAGIDAPVPDLSSLPEEILAYLRAPDGQIDPARAAELRNRVCAIQPQPAKGEGGRRGRGRMGGDDDGQGRWSLSLYHTVELENEALIAPGVPLLDLLDGDALGAGGVARHLFELEGGLFHKGLGTRFSANYASGTRVDDLQFGDFATVDMRLFANLDEQKWLVGESPGFFKGVRVGLGIDNIFDAQQRVTDENGVVPLSYQPGLIDPLGRTVEFEFRKVF